MSFVSIHAQGKADSNVVYNPKSSSARNSKPPAIPQELKEKLVVTEAEKNEYKEITKSSKGKIAKIWNHPCEFEKVVDARDDYCLSQSENMPASGYMFIGRPSDKVSGSFNTVKGEFRAMSFFNSLQVLIDVGEIDLIKITKETADVKTLSDFPVYSDQDAVKPRDLKEGVAYKNLKVADRHPIILNHTYLLRAMNLHPLTVELFTTYWRYETTYAFRVVKFENNIVTIVWKEIQSKMETQKNYQGE